MASPATTETLEIRRRGRRRLIGAITIVVILVVFLPMLLDTDQHRGASEPSTQIPSKENAPPLPAPATAPAPKPAEHAVPLAAQSAPRLEGFAVQVGAFKDEATLEQARAKLATAGVAHYTERIGGGLTRLRAGPFPTREAAEKARAALQQAALDGQVVPLP